MDQCRTAGASSLTGQNLDEPPSNSGPDGDQAERCDGNLPFASRLMALLSTAGHWTERLLSKTKSHFPAVAQTVGFGPRRSKMLYLSMGIDCLPLRQLPKKAQKPNKIRPLQQPGFGCVYHPCVPPVGIAG
jgi:hypothetical protein